MKTITRRLISEKEINWKRPIENFSRRGPLFWNDYHALTETLVETLS